MQMKHEKLFIWQESMQIAETVYELTRPYWNIDRGLMDQMRRAAVSIPSNIAEGVGKRSDRSLVYFLSISQGSLTELQTQLDLFQRIYEVPYEEYHDLRKRLVHLHQKIFAFQRKIHLAK